MADARHDMAHPDALDDLVAEQAHADNLQDEVQDNRQDADAGAIVPYRAPIVPAPRGNSYTVMPELVQALSAGPHPQRSLGAFPSDAWAMVPVPTHAEPMAEPDASVESPSPVDAPPDEAHDNRQVADALAIVPYRPMTVQSSESAAGPMEAAGEDTRSDSENSSDSTPGVPGQREGSPSVRIDVASSSDHDVRIDIASSSSTSESGETRVLPRPQRIEVPVRGETQYSSDTDMPMPASSTSPSRTPSSRSESGSEVDEQNVAQETQPAASDDSLLAQTSGRAWSFGDQAAASAASLRSAASNLRARTTSAVSTGVDAVRGGMNTAVTGVRSAGTQGVQDLARLTRPLRTQAGVVAAHAFQQAITCGIPTFCRELAAMGIAAKLAERPNLAIGLQMGAAVVNVALQALRHRQMDRHPDIAARAYHGMTEAQWGHLLPEERRALRERQQYQARLVTQMQLTAMTVNLAVSGTGLALQRPEVVSASLAFDVRNWIYAGMRESLQATFAMTDNAYPPGRSSGGVDPQRMAQSATMYGGATVVSNYLQDVLLSMEAVTDTLAEQPLTVSRFHVRDAQGALVTSGPPMVRMAALASSLRAVANTLVEIVDAYQGSHHSAAAAHGRQVVAPTRTGVDYARLRDHSPMRIAWNSIGGLPGALLQFMPPSILRSLLSNVGAGVAFGMTYPPVNSNYQAAAAVRRHVRNNPVLPAQPPATTAGVEPTAQTQQQPPLASGPSTELAELPTLASFLERPQ